MGMMQPSGCGRRSLLNQSAHPFDLIFGRPRPQPMDDFGFEQADDRLGRGVLRLQMIPRSI